METSTNFSSEPLRGSHDEVKSSEQLGQGKVILWNVRRFNFDVHIELTNELHGFYYQRF